MKPVVFLSVLLFAACGTHVFEHVVEISVADPARRLGDAVQISVFDHSMGYSREWALRELRTATPTRPYVGRWSTADVVSIGNSGPRPALDVAFALPQVSHDGYFWIQLEPVDGETRNGTASFVTYGAYFPDKPPTLTLPVRYVAHKTRNGWQIELTTEIPRP